MNERLHDSLVEMYPSITFTLSNGGSSVDIEFPYAAFDLEVDYPIVSQKTRYFPLKRADGIEQYTLGRMFLQEACVLDYFLVGAV